uniref:G-protein coupled receptors family 1 profile domain-containing protein n=1 Tax=Plectus sambesii TaxID=2011161 RepID=A0A914WUA9_9BILA
MVEEATLDLDLIADLIGDSANETIFDSYMNERAINATFEREVSNMEMVLMTVTVVTGYLYVLLTAVGIALNAYVLFWLAVLAVKDRDRFINGCGMPLAAMSLADMLSLISIVVTVLFAAFFPPDLVTDAMRTVQCKVTLFLIHTMTGVSTWCWLFVSALRYMAVYHPLWHISRWRLGQRSIGAILFCSMALNTWLLFAVVGFPNTCAETPFTIGGFVVNRWLHAIDLCWSYIIPAFITGTLDVRVLLTQPPGLARSLRNTSVSLASQSINGNGASNRMRRFITKKNSKSDDETTEQIDQLPKASTATNRPSSSDCLKKCSPVSQGARARTAVWHWLAITTIDLLLNTPDNTLRLMSVVGWSTNVDADAAPYYHLAAVVARLFYFAQFCFNAAYLSTVVYKRNVQPRSAIAPPASAANRNSSMSRYPADSELVALQSLVKLGQIHMIGTQSSSNSLLGSRPAGTTSPPSFSRQLSLDCSSSAPFNANDATQRRRVQAKCQAISTFLRFGDKSSKRSSSRKPTPFRNINRTSFQGGISTFLRFGDKSSKRSSSRKPTPFRNINRTSFQGGTDYHLIADRTSSL